MKVAVLLSGGLDSTTALHWALRHHEVVCTLSFDYGSNHAARELACARWQADHCGVPYHEIDLRAISAHLESALLSGADAIPTADYAEENLKQTVIDFNCFNISIDKSITDLFFVPVLNNIANNS